MNAAALLHAEHPPFAIVYIAKNKPYLLALKHLVSCRMPAFHDFCRPIAVRSQGSLKCEPTCFYAGNAIFDSSTQVYSAPAEGPSLPALLYMCVDLRSRGRFARPKLIDR